MGSPLLGMCCRDIGRIWQGVGWNIILMFAGISICIKIIIITITIKCGKCFLHVLKIENKY